MLIKQASNLLRETLKKKQFPEIMRRLKNLSHLKKRDKLLSKVISKKENDQRNNIKEYFMRWWRTIIREDKVVLKSTCRTLKLRNMKKFILLNKPLQKFFKRWLKGLIEIKKDNFLKTKEVIPH